MITDLPYYTKTLGKSVAEEHLPIEQRLKIVDALYEEAQILGHFGAHDLLLGLEDVVRLAAFLKKNVSTPSR